MLQARGRLEELGHDVRGDHKVVEAGHGVDHHGAGRRLRAETVEYRPDVTGPAGVPGEAAHRPEVRRKPR